MIDDSVIYREVIHRWEDEHPEVELDGNVLRAAFAADPQWTRRRLPCPACLAAWACVVAGVALLIVAVVWLVTA
jgi:hypothetical protein